MADDPYASIATPLANDPYSSIATDASQDAPERASTFGGGMIEGAKDLGQGLASIPHAIMHPIDTARAMAKQQFDLAARAKADAQSGHYGNAIWHGIDAALPGLGPLDAQLTDEYQSGAPGAKSAAMGRTLVNALPSIITEGAKPYLQPAARGVGSAMNNIAIGADADAYGANAGRGLYDAGIRGKSALSLGKQTQGAIKNAAAVHNAELSKYGAGQLVPLGDAINEPFNSTVASKTNPITGTATPAQIAKARNTQRLLNHVPDSDTGRPTTALRPLNSYSPLDANKLKSNIYGMTDYESAAKNALANSALKRAAHNIKQRIDAAVPQSVASGQHLHDIMNAADTLKGGSGVALSKHGVIDALTKTGLTYGSHGLKQGSRLATSVPANIATQALPLVAPRYDVGDQAQQLDGPDQNNVQQPIQDQPNQGNQADPYGNLNSQTQAPTPDPQYTPDSHTFSLAEWQKANPKGNPEAARKMAESLGFEVTE